MIPLLFLVMGLLPFQATQQASPAVAMEKLQAQAEAGEPGSQFELGLAYENGTGVPQNEELAAKWYRAAADHDYPPAENRLGVMYSRGNGLNQDKTEALRWYKKAAKHLLPEACFNVAISYYNGDGTPEDFNLAYAWMLVSRDAGDSQAEDALKRMADELHGQVYSGKYKLAALYEKGDEIPANIPRAIDLYREIGDANVPGNLFAGEAQYKLCQLYATGHGVPLDYSQAKSWCKKATHHGMGFAYIVLGRMAEQGLGGPKDAHEAADWYQDAALVLIPDGFLSSGKLRLQSNTPDDQKKAYFWLYLAKHYKIAAADPLLEQAAKSLDEKEIAKEQKLALDWIRMPMSEKVRQIKTH